MTAEAENKYINRIQGPFNYKKLWPFADELEFNLERSQL